MEQFRELEERNIPYRVVPGVSSAFAAAAALGIEYTLPDGTQTVIFARQPGRTPVPEDEKLSALAVHKSSMVLFLSAGMINNVVEDLLTAGYAADTPIAVVFRASWPDELIVRGTLADIAAKVEAAEVTHHGLIVVSPALRTGGRDERGNRSHLYGTAQHASEHRESVAVIALTRGGTRTGSRLHSLLPGSVLYAPARFVDGSLAQRPDVEPFSVSIRQVLQSAFRAHPALVCVMASGIVVRELAPLLRSKHADPAVVVLDEEGEFAVSLVGGHRGGANALARRVADILGGTAVITTSSDVQGLPALDLLGRDEGWRASRTDCLTDVSAALVNGEAVGIVQEAGDESWWPAVPPPNLTRYPSLTALQEAAPHAAVVITYRQVPPALLGAIPRSVLYHPPCLVVGVGCNRGTPAEEIITAVEETLEEAGLDGRSIAGVATVEDKADEEGLLAACRVRGWPLICLRREELAAAPSVPNPSMWARRALGVPGVAEPAALLAAGADSLLVEKRRFPNVTVAVALACGATGDIGREGAK